MAKAFKFSLEVLKKYRERKVLLAKRELADIQGDLFRLEDEIQSITEGRKETLASCFSQQGTSTGALLKFETFVVEGSTQKLEVLREKKAFLEQEVEKYRDWVAHLSKELKAVEKLEEKQRSRFEEEVKRRAKRADEDWVSENWGRMKERKGA